MAEAPALIDFEGKTMALASGLCGGCETNVAVKYCEECPVSLCTICAKSHQKLKITAGHTLEDIVNTESGVKLPSESQNCSRHNSFKYTSFCKECVQLLCDRCIADHSGHLIEPLNDDVKLYQKVCSKHIQQLLDDLHEFEEIKDVLESHVGTYVEAIATVDQCEIDLLKLVKERSAKLRQQLKDLKDRKYKELSNRVNGLITKLQDIDCSISTLNNIRKTMDVQLLGKELAASQALIDRLELCKIELKSLPPKSNVDDVLPSIGAMKDVSDSLDVLLTLKEIESPSPVAQWKFTASNNGKDVSKFGDNSITMKNMTYSKGPTGRVDGAVVFPRSEDECMVITNPTEKLRFDTAMTFCTQIFVEGTGNGPLFDYNKDAHFWLNPNHQSLWICNMGIDVEVNNVLNPDTWHRIALVLDASSVSMYVDGKRVKTKQGKVDFSRTQSRKLYIGCRPGENRRIRGKMAYAKFYNVPLKEDEVQKLG